MIDNERTDGKATSDVTVMARHMWGVYLRDDLEPEALFVHSHSAEEWAQRYHPNGCYRGGPVQDAPRVSGDHERGAGYVPASRRASRRVGARTCNSEGWRTVTDANRREGDKA